MKKTPLRLLKKTLRLIAMGGLGGRPNSSVRLIDELPTRQKLSLGGLTIGLWQVDVLFVIFFISLSNHSKRKLNWI